MSETIVHLASFEIQEERHLMDDSLCVKCGNLWSVSQFPELHRVLAQGIPEKASYI